VTQICKLILLFRSDFTLPSATGFTPGGDSRCCDGHPMEQNLSPSLAGAAMQYTTLGFLRKLNICFNVD
jgi:hypothetical protein